MYSVIISLLVMLWPSQSTLSTSFMRCLPDSVGESTTRVTRMDKKITQVAIYQVHHPLRVYIGIENPIGVPVGLKLMTAGNDELYAERIGKRRSVYRRCFRMAELPDGVYRFEINDRHRTIVKSFRLITPKQEAQPERFISFHSH